METWSNDNDRERKTKQTTFKSLSYCYDKIMASYFNSQTIGQESQGLSVESPAYFTGPQPLGSSSATKQ